MTKRLKDIDKNFEIATVDGNEKYDFYDIRKAPFKIYGLYNPENEMTFKRLPDDIAKSVSEGVAILSKNTSGGRVRFKTNSKSIVVKAVISEMSLMPHMAMCGSSGFDLYSKEKEGYRYRGSCITMCGNDAVEKINKNGGYENVIVLPDDEMRDYTLNFPLYNNVDAVYIGIEKGARLEPGDNYKDVKPVIYYGSSITQGGCASRPGNSYANILSRRYDIDFINLGFSGNAKGEDEIAEYISKLEMSCLVYAYDHNAPTVEHLRDTHERMYRTIRAKHPEIPVIFTSRPKVFLNQEEIERKEIIKTTYNNAKNRGENVYFVDGQEMFKLFGGDSGSVDGTHPNDLGFMCISEAVGKAFEKIYK